MRKPNWNFLVDLAAFVAFVGLVSTGILMHFQLPPGTGGSLAIWGLGRHDWGQIHFWGSVAFLGLLAIHLILHWKWLLHMVRGRTSAPGARPATRILLGGVGLLALLALALAPILSPVQTIPGGGEHGGGREGGGGRGKASLSASTSASVPVDKGLSLSAEKDTESIKGFMSLREVEAQFGVPAAVILEKLKLPANTSLDERLGPLHQQHGFEMEDIRKIVAEAKEPAAK